jgi:hypothetical protein
MTVQFFRRGDGGEETIGTIEMRNGKLIATPADSTALQNVLDDEVWIDQGQNAPLKFNAIHHPKEFLAALPKQYGHGSYFWCKRVED